MLYYFPFISVAVCDCLCGSGMLRIIRKQVSKYFFKKMLLQLLLFKYLFFLLCSKRNSGYPSSFTITDDIEPPFYNTECAGQNTHSI